MTGADYPATLEEAARDEQMHLWADLAGAIRYASNGVWSVQCDNLRYRIIALARLVGPTPWGDIDVTLLRSGMYAKVLDEAAILFPPIDWDAVARTEAVIAGGVNR